MTSAPSRIQRRRTKGWRAPEGAVYVGRPTLYGNPFRVDREPSTGLWIVHVPAGDGVRAQMVGDFQFVRQAREAATGAFRAMLRTPGGAEQAEFFARKLAGRDLMCWCPLPAPGEPDHCHAAVLLELANRAAS